MLKTDPGVTKDPKGAGWALATLLLASRFLGLAPVSLERDNRPRPSLFWRVYSISFLLCFAGLVVWNVRFCAELFLPSTLHPVHVSSFIIIMIQNVAAIIALVSSCWNGGAWIRVFFEMLYSVDKILGIQEYSVHRKLRQNTILLVAILSIVFSLFFIIEMISTPYYQFFPFFIGHFLSDVFIIQYVSVIILLKHRITELNFRLTIKYCDVSTLVPRRKGPLFEYVPSRVILPIITTYEVNRLAEAFTTLHKISYSIGMQLGVPLLAQFLQILVGVVCWMFMLIFVIKFFMTQWTNHLVVTVIMTIHSVAKMMLISLKSHSVMEHSQKTSRLVHRLMVRLQQMQSLHPDANKTTRALQQMSLQLLHERLQLNAYGILPLDKTLLLSAAAFVFTNVLLLLQFTTGKSDDPLKDFFRES